MKRIISVFVICLIIMSVCGTTVFAAYEAPTEFSCVFDYQGRTYTTDYYGTNGGITFRSAEDLYSLPDIYYNGYQEYIWSFCIYHDKLYVVAGAASESMPTNIYSCNLDGSSVTLLADNADNFGKVTIVDGVLYYAAFASENNSYYTGYYGGIYSINLNDLSWKKICSDKADINYCDGDYMYYSIYPNGYQNTYAIRTNGTGKMRVNPYCDEFINLEYKTGILKGNQLYYNSGNQLYVRTKNGDNARWLGSVPYGEYQDMVAVTDNYVYFVNMNYPYANLYKLSR